MTPCQVCNLTLVLNGDPCTLCQRRIASRERHRAIYAIRREKKCKHCKRNRQSACRGLCGTCSKNPEIRVKYPARDQRERNPLPVRREGDAAYRCIWCMAWKCENRMEKCKDCEAKYYRMVEACGVMGSQSNG